MKLGLACEMHRDAFSSTESPSHEPQNEEQRAAYLILIARLQIPNEVLSCREKFEISPAKYRDRKASRELHEG